MGTNPPLPHTLARGPFLTAVRRFFAPFAVFALIFPLRLLRRQRARLPICTRGSLLLRIPPGSLRP